MNHLKLGAFGSLAVAFWVLLLPAVQATKVTPAVASDSVDAIARNAPRGQLGGPATPVHYSISLEVLPERERFAGEVAIDVVLTERVEGLYLHGKNLNVTRSNVRTADGGRVRANYRQLTDDGVAYVAFGRPVNPQTLTLEFGYDAPFDRQLLGLYRVDEDGRSYAFTQFESIFARKAFVSFDEPQHKTTFDMALTVHEEHVAIFNTEAVRTDKAADGMKTVRFATTEKLPTYLVAIAVGDLDVVEGAPVPPNGPRKKPLPLRGIAAHGKGADLAHALATTGALLAPLETYFDQPYPYSKLDIIAVPDFQSGAMENAGAITFRERLLLLRDDAPVTQRQAYASVMAHELAHMWFGNLVTMPWWNDIWLNESFATWMSYKAIDVYDPGARPELRRLGRLRTAKKEDGLQSARQIREPVDDHHGIVAAFDSITYAKGGAVLNMMEHYVGKDIFRDAVRDHMRRFAWGSADVNDFIDSLVRASEPGIEPSFKSFLFQNGLPRVAVEQACADGNMRLSQSRYVPTGLKRGKAQTWEFPVCVRSGTGDQATMQCEWLREPSAEFTFKGGVCPEWMMLDADYSGYYHWSMAAADYAALARLGAGSLSDIEWESVVDSIEAGLADGSVSVTTAWQVLAPLATSEFRSVALAPSRVMRHWLERFSDEPKLSAGLRTAAQRLYDPREAIRAFDPAFVRALERDEDRVFYAKMADFMARHAGSQLVRAAALAQVSEAFTDKSVDLSKLESLTLETMLTVAVQDGDASVREHVLQAFLDSRDGQQRRVTLNALGHARDNALADQLQALALNDGIRRNEIERLLSAQFKEPNVRNDAWRFVRQHYLRLIEIMPPRHAARLPARVAGFCDDVMRAPMEALFGPQSERVPGGKRQLDKALESMAHCAARAQTERDAVRQLFSPGIRR